MSNHNHHPISNKSVYYTSKKIQKLQKKEKKKKSKVRKVVKGLLFSILILILLFCGVVFFYVKRQIDEYRPKAEEVVQSLDLSSYQSSFASHIYYKNKKGKWKILETLYQEQDNEWIPYDEIPDALKRAAIAIEDKRFEQHNGVDWKRTFSAGFNYIVKQENETAGGSTITQQLLKNLTGNKQVTLERKFMEILEALEFEKHHSKKEILELYLNNVYFGNNCNGIYRAAKKYFAKDVRDLTITESAILVGLTNNPEYYNPYKHPENAKLRGAIILGQMYDQGILSTDTVTQCLQEFGYTMESEKPTGLFAKWQDTIYHFDYNAKNDQLEFKDGSIHSKTVNDESDHILSWYTDAVISKTIDELMDLYGYDKEQANTMLYSGGLEIYTALDPSIQKIVNNEYKNRYVTENNQAYDEPLPPQSAITVVDNATGAVVALSGGLGKKESSRTWNRAIDTVRPTGSSIKPLGVYGPALDLNAISPQTMINDSEFKKDENGMPWPVNADGVYRGQMSVHDAVVSSINTVAVKCLDKIGIDTSYKYLTENFHITSLQPEDKDYGPLALGGFTNGISTYEMAAAFSVFPREGFYIEPFLYSKITDRDGNIIIEHGKVETEAISTKAAHQMTSILRDAVEYGTGTGARLYTMDAAGKTGTTSNAYDLWFCGFTPYYTAAVWSGYDTQKEMSNSGSNPSVSIWRDIMSNIHNGLEFKKLKS